jgi:multiple sugar transport system permease protein
VAHALTRRLLGRGSRPQLGGACACLALVSWTAVCLFPAYWLLVTSFKGADEITTVPPSFWIRRPTTANYEHILFAVEVPLVRWLWNSLVVSVGSTIGTVLVCGMAGYAFARLRFRGRETLFWALLATTLVPDWSTLVPALVWTRTLGLHDTHWVLILPHLASPFAVFLVRQFMVTHPRELFDAARVDGATEVGIWWRIAMPLARPALAALGAFTFIGSWNDFLWPLVVTNKAAMFTAQVGVVTMRSLVLGSGPQYGVVMATAVVLSLPPVLAFFLMQRHLVRGLTMGALKG